jgi:type IV pilus assembly protein PilV
MMEIVIAIFFITVVFMGHIGSQSFMQKSSMETARRAQAQILLNDIVERMQANRSAIRCYAFSGAGGSPYVGSGGSAPAPCGGFADPETQLIADTDLQAWHRLLSQGSSSTGGTATGGLKKGRGCIAIDETTNPDTYTVSIAWEGSDNLSIPGNINFPCASGTYGTEFLRRVISTQVQFADLKA